MLAGFEIIAVILLVAGCRRAWRRRRSVRVTRRRATGLPRAPVIIEGRPGQGPRRFPAAMREYILRRDGYRCTNCGSNKRLEADHIVPYSKGGATVPSNAKTLCHECNSLKSNTFAE